MKIPLSWLSEYVTLPAKISSEEIAEAFVKVGFEVEGIDEQGKDFGVLQIDAHADLRDAYEGFSQSHASIMFNVLQHAEHMSKLVQVGIRDVSEREVFLSRDSDRVQTYYDWNIKNEQYAGKTWASQVEEMIQHLPMNVYVSFDIDGLSPELCPNTGTPVAGGFKLEEGTNVDDSYQASSFLNAGYAMVDARLFSKLRIVTGARLESYNQQFHYIEFGSNAQRDLDTTVVDILPSINLTYSFTKRFQFRASASRTLSRPEFRELAPFEFYNFNDIFVLCTREATNSTSVEGFGLVFLEAQACGIPVIGVRSGGIPDAIEEGNGGWLIEQDNELKLANLFQCLIDNRELVVKEGKKARIRVVEKANWKKYNESLYKILTN